MLLEHAANGGRNGLREIGVDAEQSEPLFPPSAD